MSFENKKRTKLFSLLRLRIIPQNKAMIREVHTYGPVVPIGKTKIAAQHRGLGKKLIKVAEKIAKKEFKSNEVSVIAGVGVRNYFKGLGYKLKGTYMVKEI